jgi:hypothetical protein
MATRSRIAIENEDGTYIVSPLDTSAIYLTILSLNREQIGVSGFTYPNQESFYTFNTSMFNEFIESNKPLGFKFADNIKQGQAGNISLAYKTISKDYKVINQSMYNIVKKSQIVVVLIKDSQKYYLEINNLSDWNDFIQNKIKESKPLRLFIRNVSPEECSTFYLKPINAHLNSVYKGLIDNFVLKNGLVELKSREIRETYKIDLTHYLENVSNNNFPVKVEDGQIKKIYLVEKTHLFFPNEVNAIHFYDNYSFIKREYQIKTSSPLFEIIDPILLFSEYFENSIIDPMVYFMRKQQIHIDTIIKNIIKTSKDVILNYSDVKILKRLGVFTGKIFDVVVNKEGKYTVRIKEKNSSSIQVSLYDRHYNRFDNVDNQVTWFTAINQGLSFEREKTLSIFHIEDFVKKLIKKGHTNITIELEKPINKKDGRKGFLDFVIKSTFDGDTYGQVQEFKAVYNWDSLKSIYQVQADNYDITQEIIDGYNISKSYEGMNFLEVDLINLIN